MDHRTTRGEFFQVLYGLTGWGVLCGKTKLMVGDCCVAEQSSWLESVVWVNRAHGWDCCVAEQSPNVFVC